MDVNLNGPCLVDRIAQDLVQPFEVEVPLDFPQVRFGVQLESFFQEQKHDTKGLVIQIEVRGNQVDYQVRLQTIGLVIKRLIYVEKVRVIDSVLVFSFLHSLEKGPSLFIEQIGRTGFAVHAVDEFVYYKAAGPKKYPKSFGVLDFDLLQGLHQELLLEQLSLKKGITFQVVVQKEEFFVDDSEVIEEVGRDTVGNEVRLDVSGVPKRQTWYQHNHVFVIVFEEVLFSALERKANVIDVSLSDFLARGQVPNLL